MACCALPSIYDVNRHTVWAVAAVILLSLLPEGVVANASSCWAAELKEGIIFNANTLKL